ncbi:MAG TPA: PIG-L family deacetylase [Bryobacteraceae bacterium]|jgi:LmbE family N-acetylglucosaminyl deacetylase|nr:PIG-L family deacetylase [Bryobacteraceae bacterium]
MRIVSIHAHPDDAEILAGSTLALLSRLGHDIVIVTLSAGDCGSTMHAADEIASIRKAEAAESAALIGAGYRWAGFRDMAIFSDDPSRRAVTGLLRELRPDVVLTAAPSDYLCDHEATSQLVRDACFAASIPNYGVPAQNPPLPAIPHLYFMDPIGQQERSGQPPVPDFTVDVASEFETKRAMLAKHQSQKLWLQQQHGVKDYIQQMEDWTRACGARAGIVWGEGFRQYKLHPYPQEPLLQHLLSRYLANP